MLWTVPLGVKLNQRKSIKTFLVLSIYSEQRFESLKMVVHLNLILTSKNNLIIGPKVRVVFNFIVFYKM